MNFLAHLYLSGENEEIKFGNFIGDWVKGNKYESYSENIKIGILMHRRIDSYTDKHSTVHKSIFRLRPAYGKFAGVVVDILYDHFLAKYWKNYSEVELEDYVKNFHCYVIKNFKKLPAGALRFAFPFIQKKRLICYADLICFEEVLEKMAVYTSMPDKTKTAMEIINKDYELFNSEFNQFFTDIRNYIGIK
jgi:acyl carrier protein phosphodiesterase